MEGATSKQKFQSYTIHLEFCIPFQPAQRGQGRGNSGYYAQGCYEVQILDSFGLVPNNNECCAVYGVKAPDITMSFSPLSWQTYDVAFTAAGYKDGKKVKNARMTVRHNGGRSAQGRRGAARDHRGASAGGTGTRTGLSSKPWQPGAIPQRLGCGEEVMRDRNSRTVLARKDDTFDGYQLAHATRE